LSGVKVKIYFKSTEIFLNLQLLDNNNNNKEIPSKL